MSRCPQWIGSNVPPRMPTRRAGVVMRLRSRLVRRQPSPHRLEQFRDTLTADAGHAEERQTELAGTLFEGGDLLELRGIDGVHLIGNHDLRFGRECGLIQLELLAHDVEILDRLPTGPSRNLSKSHQT